MCRLRQSEFRRRSIGDGLLLFVGIFLFLTPWAVVPNGVWTPPSEARRIGPLKFDSRVQMEPSVAILELEDLAKPTQVRIDFRFRIFSRPSDFAFVISTSDSSNGGLRIAIDQYANLFLEVGSREAPTGISQVIKISEPFDFNQWQHVGIRFDQIRKQLKVLVNGQVKPNVSARPNTAFEIEHATSEIGALRLGGTNGHDLAGEIRDFRATYGRTVIKINLANLKILLSLAALMVGAIAISRLLARGNVKNLDSRTQGSICGDRD